MDESLAEADLSKLYDAALDEFEAHRHKNALPLFEKLLELEHGVLPTEVRIHVREALGKCCFNLRRYGDAAKYYREALATLETSTSFGATHDKTMHVRYKLARALSAVSKLHLTFMRNLREAVALHEKNLDIIKSKGNSTLYKETMHNSASILCKLTKYDKAEPIYKELLEAKRIKSRGLTDRESLELKHEYASVLYHLKRYEDSKQLFLQIQGILLPLSHSRNRKLDELGQSVDKYLAACIEATNDINLGAARAMKSAAERRPQAMPKPTVYSEMRATTAPVVPSRNRPHQRQDENSTTTASPISAKPNHQQNSSQNNGRLTACELNDQTPSRSRESSRAAPGLDVPQALVATARRAKSDQSLSTVSKIVSRQHPVARPKSTQPSQTTKNDDNGTPSTSVHARSSLQPSTVDNGAWPPSSRSTSSGTARNPNISVASTSRSPSHTQSSESQTVIPKPVRNRRQFPGMLPQTTISVPVVHSSPTPETSSAAKSQTPGARVQQVAKPKATKDLAVPVLTLTSAEHSNPQKPNTMRSQSDNIIPQRSRTRNVMILPTPALPPDTGQLLEIPPGLSDADEWFFRLRSYTHQLLEDGQSKNRHRKPVRIAVLDSGLTLTRGGVPLPMARHWKKRIQDKRVTYQDFTGLGTSYADHRDNTHGTLCASFLLQMISVRSKAELFIANVVSPDKAGQEPSHVANAIAWAIANDVDIISMSFGWLSLKWEVDKQIKIARTKGILLFAAASNDGGLTPKHGMYPASDATVHCIYSCSGSGEKSAFNPPTSKHTLSFMFPGEDLALLEASHKPMKDVDRQQGTSFATPLAAGTAALILDLVRSELTNSTEVEQRLKHYEGMSDIFQAMSVTADDKYFYVQPWVVLGEDKPEISPHINHTHKWHTLMIVLSHLKKRFGPFSPLV